MSTDQRNHCYRDYVGRYVCLLFHSIWFDIYEPTYLEGYKVLVEYLSNNYGVNNTKFLYVLKIGKIRTNTR